MDTVQVESKKKERILLVDQYNCFIRSYAAYPAMSNYGYQMGGTIGSIKTIKKIIDEFRPHKVYVIWEGGGSTRRRSIDPNYKMQRMPERLNRFYEDDIPESNENRQHQIYVLINLLKKLPLYQIYVEDCEGDDIIHYLTTSIHKDDEILIASNDRDYYQLLNDDVKIYNLTKKIIKSTIDVEKEFHVTYKNFALAKSICGDVADNVTGIKGVGFKKLSKYIPLFLSNDEITLDNVLDYCRVRAQNKVTPIYKKILDDENQIRKNWKLVYLNSSVLSSSQIDKIKYTIDNSIAKPDRIAFMKLLIKEGITNFDINSLFSTFQYLSQNK